MAEIKIEKKKPIWPWILLVLVLLAAIAYFVYANNEKDDDFSDDMNSEDVDNAYDTNEKDTITYQNATEYTNSGAELTRYRESIMDSNKIGIDSTYTKTALHNLSEAVIAKASQYNMESSKSLEDLELFSDQMDDMSDSKIMSTSEISKNLKTFSTNVTSVLEAIQSQKFPALQNDVSDLKQTTGKFTTAIISKQQGTLQAFLSKTEDVLNKMNL